MAGKKHIDVQMGEKWFNSYIEVSGLGAVTPAEAMNVQPWQRPSVPGWNAKSFEGSLSPIVLNIKAGTEGTITIWVDVDYDYVDMVEHGGLDLGPFGSIPGKKFPNEETGTVTHSGTWSYKCSMTGELTITNFVTDNSSTGDDFAVNVDGFVPSKPTQVILNVKSKYSGSYVGPILQLIAFLKVTDVPPPPPPPPPKPLNLEVLEVMIPFGKEGQTNLDDKARRIASDWAKALFQKYPALELPIARGEVFLYFTGYASKTGKIAATTEQMSDDFNVEIGEARARSAVNYLIPSYLGSGAKAISKSKGRQYAQWAKVYDKKLRQMVEVVGQPRDIDRYVMVWVDEDDAKKILNK